MCSHFHIKDVGDAPIMRRYFDLLGCSALTGSLYRASISRDPFYDMLATRKRRIASKKWRQSALPSVQPSTKLPFTPAPISHAHDFCSTRKHNHRVSGAHACMQGVKHTHMFACVCVHANVASAVCGCMQGLLYVCKRPGCSDVRAEGRPVRRHPGQPPRTLPALSLRMEHGRSRVSWADFIPSYAAESCKKPEFWLS